MARRVLLKPIKRGSSVKVRAKVHVEKTKNKEIIVLDEMPFQTNKAKLVEQISDLVREKQIEGISEVLMKAIERH